jgi:hypothetical protein
MRKNGISSASVYMCKVKHGGLDAIEFNCIKELVGQPDEFQRVLAKTALEN